METINVMHSLISSGSLIDYLSNYNIGKVLECRFLTRGLNDTYLVTTENKRFIFRVYRKGWREYADIEFELEAISHLYNENISVSFPIKRTDGNFINEIPAPEGIRYAVLFTYGEGKTPDLNEKTSGLLGKTLSLIHKHSDSFQSKYKRSFLLNQKHLIDEPLSLISPIAEAYLSQDDYNYLKYACNNIKENILSANLEIGFCHGDFHDWNVNYKDGKVTVFDFDCCGNGFRAYDIAVFLWNLKNNYKDREEISWKSFLDGYLSIRSISQCDINAIPYFISARRIWLMGIYLKNQDVWGTNWINENNIKNFVNSLKQDEAEISKLKQSDIM